jgi:hypothetical protein
MIKAELMLKKLWNMIETDYSKLALIKKKR